MKLSSRILSLIGLIYSVVMSIRNGLFEFGVLKQHKSTIPIISIGNLSMGGTGKTPHIAFIIRNLKHNKKVVLSRGYGRKRKDLIDGDSKKHSCKDIGDEPLELLEKFDSENFKIIVNANRKDALNYLEKIEYKTDIILLDDGYQHRYVKRDLNILLTDINKPFYLDSVFPSGSLRERKKGANRADLIIVTKCIPNLSLQEQNIIRNKIKTYSKAPIYFSFIKYLGFKNTQNKFIELTTQGKYLLITGIAFPSYIKDYLSSKQFDYKHMSYDDHHDFSDKEIKEIAKKSCKFDGIITTEKDWMRLRDKNIHSETNSVFYRLEIEVKLLHSEKQFMKHLNQI